VREVEANIVNILNLRANQNIPNTQKVLNLQSSHKNKCKLEDGNGPILSSKGLVHVQEEGTQRHYLGLPSSFSEGITSLEKQKDTLILMTHIFWT
jgi:hypothetical protein